VTSDGFARLRPLAPPAGAHPSLPRPLHPHPQLIRPAQQPRCIGRAVEPVPGHATNPLSYKWVSVIYTRGCSTSRPASPLRPSRTLPSRAGTCALARVSAANFANFRWSSRAKAVLLSKSLRQPDGLRAELDRTDVTRFTRVTAHILFKSDTCPTSAQHRQSSQFRAHARACARVGS